MSDNRCVSVLQAVIVDMCVGEGCLFDTGAVYAGMSAGVSAFLSSALRKQTKEAKHVLRKSLAWVHDLLLSFA